MADLMDQSSDVEQVLNDAALSKRVVFEGVARMDCAECGDPIEGDRRRLLGGQCIYCAACAQYFEIKNRKGG